MTNVQRIIFAAIVTVVAVACSGVAPAAAPNIRIVPQAATPEPTSLQVGLGDQVRVEVFGNPDLATTTNVAEDGTIRVPLIGLVNVGGLSTADAARKIEAAFKAGQFLVNPQVTVVVVQAYSQLVTILGEVATPGRYPIKFDSTLFDIVALAGGITEKGSDVVYVLRDDAAGVTQRIPVDMGSVLNSQGVDAGAFKFSLQVGDTILVPKGTFLIAGQVANPGEYRIEGEMILFEAIARAGDVTPLGSASRVEIRRRGPDGKVFEVKKVNKYTKIEPGDVIRVKERLF